MREIRPRERVVHGDPAIGETVVGETLGRQLLPAGPRDLEVEADDHLIALGHKLKVVEVQGSPATQLGQDRPEAGQVSTPLAGFT